MSDTKISQAVKATPKPILAGIPILCCVALAFWLWPKPPLKLFPSLKPGSYVGAITGISQDPSKSVSLYLERIENTDGLLLVLFDPGWKARFLPLFVPDGTEAEETPPGYKPVQIAVGEQSFLLSGNATSTGYIGMLERDGVPAGKWAIEPASVKELRAGNPSLEENFDFVSWLRTKGRHRIRMQELSEISDTLNEEYSHFKKTSDVVIEETGLRAASSELRKELEEEVQKLREQDSEYKKRVNDLVRELEQLRRITKGGRSIELARRVVTRENKWYQVNWSQGEDLSGIEESLADSRGIDLEKLNRRYKQALEIKRLKNQIAQEKSKIQKLQRQYQEKLKGGTQDEEEKEKKKPWWRRLDTVFG